MVERRWEVRRVWARAAVGLPEVWTETHGRLRATAG